MTTRMVMASPISYSHALLCSSSRASISAHYLILQFRIPKPKSSFFQMDSSTGFESFFTMEWTKASGEEIQDVSREFKSTLEREIGLDEISTSMQKPYSNDRTNAISTPPAATRTEDSQNVADPDGSPSPNRAYTSEEYLKIAEEQLKTSAAQQQVQSGGNRDRTSNSVSSATTIEAAELEMKHRNVDGTMKMLPREQAHPSKAQK